MNDDLRAPDCKLFVDGEIGQSELLSLLITLLFPNSAAAIPGAEAEVDWNEGYHSERRRLFPDGFMYFRYVVDLYLPDAPLEQQAALVTRTLNGLWDQGFPAVAACDFEAQLPEHGGYKSRAIPWP